MYIIRYKCEFGKVTFPPSLCKRVLDVKLWTQDEHSKGVKGVELIKKILASLFPLLPCSSACMTMKNFLFILRFEKIRCMIEKSNHAPFSYRDRKNQS